MLKEIFTSSARIDLMAFFLQKDDQEIHMSMLKNQLSRNLSSFQKEVDNLVKIGFIMERKNGNRRLLKLNTNFVIHNEIKQIFIKNGMVFADIKKFLERFTSIRYAFIYKKDIDAVSVILHGCNKILFVVTEDSFDQERKLREGLVEIARDDENISLDMYTLAEMQRGIAAGDPSLREAVNSNKIMLIEN